MVIMIAMMVIIIIMIMIMIMVMVVMVVVNPQIPKDKDDEEDGDEDGDDTTLDADGNAWDEAAEYEREPVEAWTCSKERAGVQALLDTQPGFPGQITMVMIHKVPFIKVIIWQWWRWGDYNYIMDGDDPHKKGKKGKNLFNLRH